MDYFVYKREYKPDEWEPCSFKKAMRVAIFVYHCPNCGERIWGAWEYPRCDGKLDPQNGAPIAWINLTLIYCFEHGFEKTLDMYRNRDNKISSIDYPIYRRIADYGNEVRKFTELDSCPICGAKLSKQYLSDIQKICEAQHFKTIESAFAWHRKDISTTSRSKGYTKHIKFLAYCSNESTAIVPESKKCKIENVEQLMDFLKHIITTEKNIYSVSERLKALYKVEYEYEVYAKESSYTHLDDKRNEVAAIHKALVAKQGENPETSVPTPKYDGAYPSKPAEPQAPNAPILAKPGLFNKKKILAENATLMAQYEKEYAHYEERLNIYNEELDICNQRIAQIQAEQEKKRIELVEKAKLVHAKECEELREKYLAAQQEYEQISSSFDSISTPQVTALKCLQEEISQAEELLLNLHQGKRSIFNTGVIFEKYNDFVAIASFYEYFASGRCTTLEGPHGAYNLYESEIRMNAIVSQLADVIKSLKQIQKNQFVIYTAINEATNELAMLNKATQKMNATLGAMHGKLETISRNTEVTAYYAKKSAELADTLCFLTALN